MDQKPKYESRTSESQSWEKEEAHTRQKADEQSMGYDKFGIRTLV